VDWLDGGERQERSLVSQALFLASRNEKGFDLSKHEDHKSDPYQFAPLSELLGDVAAQQGEAPIKKSALKKAHQSVLNELRKFQLSLNERMMRRFPETSLTSDSEGERSYGKVVTVISPTSTIRSCRSDSALATMGQRDYLNRKEQSILQHMDDGLSAGKRVRKATGKSSKSSHSRHHHHTSGQIVGMGNVVASGVASRHTTSIDDGLRRGRLRFSAEVEVVEYDTDAQVSDSLGSSLSSSHEIFPVGFDPDRELKPERPTESYADPHVSVGSFVKFVWDVACWATTSLLGTDTTISTPLQPTLRGSQVEPRNTPKSTE
jgi:hypothetical protein